MKKRTKSDIIGSMRFSHIVVGGTFDHIHNGHVVLLTRAFFEGEKVTIGLTSDAYVRRYKTKTALIHSYEIRKKQLEAWVKKQGGEGRTTIVPIDDAYGPTTKETDFDAIVVSQETESVATIMNALRTKKGLPPLAIIVVPMVQAEDTNRISSTRIRNNEIDYEGRLTLPDALRKTLTQPIGTLIPDGTRIPVLSKDTTSISVGDTTTAKLLSWGMQPTLACIDFQAQRQAFDWEKTLWETLVKDRSVSYFTSGPGFIGHDVMGAIARWSEHPNQTLFVIDGEEDLLVLPAILYAPLGTLVYYGQPDKGIIRVLVTSKMKKKVSTLLSQFT
jgi:pantetheine-phosphate adenylyltransferase